MDPGFARSVWAVSKENLVKIFIRFKIFGLCSASLIDNINNSDILPPIIR